LHVTTTSCMWNLWVTWFVIRFYTFGIFRIANLLHITLLKFFYYNWSFLNVPLCSFYVIGVWLHVIRQVWLGTKIFICLWHVKRAWLKQTCIKIKDVSTCASALKVLGNIMYNANCPNDQELDAWAKIYLVKVANEMSITNSF
jgi:hypothetical protein